MVIDPVDPPADGSCEPPAPSEPPGSADSPDCCPQAARISAPEKRNANAFHLVRLIAPSSDGNVYGFGFAHGDMPLLSPMGNGVYPLVHLLDGHLIKWANQARNAATPTGSATRSPPAAVSPSDTVRAPQTFISLRGAGVVGFDATARIGQTACYDFIPLAPSPGSDEPS